MKLIFCANDHTVIYKLVVLFFMALARHAQGLAYIHENFPCKEFLPKNISTQ